MSIAAALAFLLTAPAQTAPDSAFARYQAMVKPCDPLRDDMAKAGATREFLERMKGLRDGEATEQGAARLLGECLDAVEAELRKPGANQRFEGDAKLFLNDIAERRGKLTGEVPEGLKRVYLVVPTLDAIRACDVAGIIARDDPRLAATRKAAEGKNDKARLDLYQQAVVDICYKPAKTLLDRFSGTPSRGQAVSLLLTAAGVAQDDTATALRKKGLIR